MSASPDSTIGRPVGYGPLLRNNSKFRRLFLAQLISAGGDWFNSVAVLGLVLQLTNSGLSISLALICSTLPPFFLIPFAGPVVDRFDRRKLMIVTNAASAVIALLFLFVRDSSMLWLLYVSSTLLIVSASFFAPASSASIPNIVSEEELFSANALSGSTWGIMLTVGSALGGIVSNLFGRDFAFVINALSFLVASILIAPIDIPSPKVEREVHPWRDFVEGLSYLRAYLPAFSLVMVEIGWGLAMGVLVLISVAAVQVFHAGDAGIGWLYAARGFGAMIGPFAIRSIVGRDVAKGRTAIWVAFLLAALGYLIFAGAGWINMLALACVGLFIAHCGGGIVWTIPSVLLQQTTPDRFRGRVFAARYGFSTLTTGVSTLLFGLALQANVTPMTLAVIGAIIFTIYGIGWGLMTSTGRFHVSEATIAAMPQL
jgi:MFS family permease